MSSDREEDNMLQGDSEDEFDWEEVEVPAHQPQHLEITLNAKPKAEDSTNKSVTEFREIGLSSYFSQEKGHIARRTSDTYRLP